MDFEHVELLRDNSAAWRLLRADNAALVLSFLGETFVEANSPAIVESELTTQLDDALYALNGARGGEDEPRFPRTARAYLQAWSAPEQGWLRRFYPPGSEEPHYDATPALEKAYGWVSGLQERSFVGTESRLHTLVGLLRQMVHGAETDPDARLSELLRRREELDAEIREAERGEVEPMDRVALRDRYQLFSRTARDLLSDFREVEDNFRRLDRAARQRIASWAGAKGELLEELLDDRTSISASDQGRSFQAFYDFLLSRGRQDELADLLAKLQQIDDLEPEPRMRHINYDWLDAAERTQQTVRQLSEQLRRFLDDQVWLENRRVVELLRSIETSAFAVRDEPGAARDPRLTMRLDATSPTVSMPMERPLYVVREEVAVDSSVTEASEGVDTTALFEQVYVDQVRLAEVARHAVRRRGQVALADLLSEHPPEQGLAEIVSYLALSEDDLDVVIAEGTEVQQPYLDAEGTPRTLRMPDVTLTRRAADPTRRSR